MRCFIDLHHEHLYESFRLLFEKRLGFEIYRPIGLDWYEQKYWKIDSQLSTAIQYLSLNIENKLQEQKNPVVTDISAFRYMNFNSFEIEPGVYEVETPAFPGVKYRAIELEAFKSTRFDLIICSIPDHVQPYMELVQKYQPQAKLIFQAGNNWFVPAGIENVLSSSKICMDSKKNCVFYHQEFDSILFSQQEKISLKSFSSMKHQPEGSENFFLLEKLLPDWKAKCYGIWNRDFSRGPGISDIAMAFKEMGFLYHVKREGDGFGYNIHYAVSTGTPLIVKKSYFKDMTAEDLLIDGVTCIDMDVHSVSETALLLEAASDDYQSWSDRTRKLFTEVVNYEVETEDIKKFIERLV